MLLWCEIKHTCSSVFLAFIGLTSGCLYFGTGRDEANQDTVPSSGQNMHMIKCRSEKAAPLSGLAQFRYARASVAKYLSNVAST